MGTSDLVAGDLYHLTGAILGFKENLSGWWFERGYYIYLGKVGIAEEINYDLLTPSKVEIYKFTTLIGEIAWVKRKHLIFFQKVKDENS